MILAKSRNNLLQAVIELVIVNFFQLKSFFMHPLGELVIMILIKKLTLTAFLRAIKIVMY